MSLAHLGFLIRPVVNRSERTSGTLRLTNMGELKMEKKGDAELAKITSDIDALKEEAAQVRPGFHPSRFELRSSKPNRQGGPRVPTRRDRTCVRKVVAAPPLTLTPVPTSQPGKLTEVIEKMLAHDKTYRLVRLHDPSPPARSRSIATVCPLVRRFASRSLISKLARSIRRGFDSVASLRLFFFRLGSITPCQMHSAHASLPLLGPRS